jgi:hypothetical protein
MWGMFEEGVKHYPPTTIYEVRIAIGNRAIQNMITEPRVAHAHPMKICKKRKR